MADNRMFNQPINSIETMPIGKSKILDMDFGSFENTIDKNIETDKTSDKFDQQQSLQGCWQYFGFGKIKY